MAADPHQLAGVVKLKDTELGFVLAGIAPAEPSGYRDYFRQWLDDGRHGTMEWLAARFAERNDPAIYMPGAKSVICVAVNYFVPLDPPENCSGRVARYALGDDYHEIIKPRLHKLADWLRTIAPDATTRCAVRSEE